VLTPDVTVPSVTAVTPQLLRELGVKGVLVDLDDTLLPSDGQEFGPGISGWLDELRQAGIAVLLLSNGERDRVRYCCDTLGIEGYHLAGKPFFWAFRRGLRRLGLPKGEVAMVGDQLFTDVLGANWAGITSILVTPLTQGQLPHTRLARRLERLVLRGGEGGGTVDR